MTFQRNHDNNFTLYLLFPFWWIYTHTCDSNRGDISTVHLFMSHLLTKSTKKTNFLLKCKVIFQRNESVKGHADLKWFHSFFHNWNEIFLSIEFEWNYWNISFKLESAQYTQEKERIQCERCKITKFHISKQMSITDHWNWLTERVKDSLFSIHGVYERISKQTQIVLIRINSDFECIVSFGNWNKLRLTRYRHHHRATFNIQWNICKFKMEINKIISRVT